MGILTMPSKGKSLVARILGLDVRAYSAKKVIDDAYARADVRPSPDLKNAYRAYKAAQKNRGTGNRSG